MDNYSKDAINSVFETIRATITRTTNYLITQLQNLVINML